MNYKNITETDLFANLIREPLAPEKQRDIVDNYYKSIIGSRTILEENGSKEVPNDIYWNYAWRYSEDDCRTATICNRNDANCIVIETIDKIYFLELNKEV